ncbi:MAG: hypothetical protein AUH86_25645 [Acidobacteria bacterium 13_1_40CM_4_58_4]|nr:MAG: hypothetical protein AUH86_25645 [Acidobacteria bacterium 13_1_40CM_4_58_4]PYV53672.1 MAG: hypothetical protein DMG98_20360 [Acidobacteriota bacterium]
MQACNSSTVRSGGWVLRLLLFSLLVDGAAIPIAGRTPTVLAFDVLLPLVVVYMLWQNLFGACYWGFPDKTLFCLGLTYFFAQLLSLLFNFRDTLRSILLIKISFFGFLVYWIAIARTRSRIDLDRITNCLIAWGGILGLILLYRFVTDWASLIGPEASYEVKELGISIGRSNYLAALLVPIFPLTLAAVTARTGCQKLMPILAAFAMAAGLLITFSKGALLALVVGAIVALPLLVKNGLRFRHVILFVVLAAVFLWVMPRDLVLSNYEMVAYRLNNPDLERPDLWRVAWREFLEHPILGIGPNCIYIYNRQYAIDVLHTHNFILNWLAEGGLVGALPFFAIISVLIRRSYNICLNPIQVPGLKRVCVALYVSLLSTLLHGLVEPTFQGPQYSVIFWSCAALIFLYDPDRGLSNKTELTTA